MHKSYDSYNKYLRGEKLRLGKNQAAQFFKTDVDYFLAPKVSIIRFFLKVSFSSALKVHLTHGNMQSYLAKGHLSLTFSVTSGNSLPFDVTGILANT